MSIINGYILPHPPLLVIGSEEEKSKLQATLRAFEEVAKDIKESDSELIILITPHGPLFVDGLCVYDREKNVGNFSSFGHKEITGMWDNDINFIEDLYQEALVRDLPFVKLDPQIIKTFDLSSELDHGAMVPLKLLESAIDKRKVVVINYGLLPVDTLYQFGRLLTDTLEKQDKKAMIIASGDLSHYLSEEGPYGYREEGRRFDENYVQAFEENDWMKLLFVDEELLSQAGECGKRSVEVLLGAFDTVSYHTEKLSYEAPFGVGYLLGRFKATQAHQMSRLTAILEKQKDLLKDRISKESPVVQLARESIKEYLSHESIMRNPEPLVIEASGRRSGVFVSLNDAGGLRGCMGSTGGIAPTVEEEIIDMAIKSATKDPRFDEVTLEELDYLQITVDILSRSEQVIDLKELDTNKYGIIVKSNHKQGLLLPNLEGIDSVDKQVEIVLNKAGINPKEEEYELYKFTVSRYY